MEYQIKRMVSEDRARATAIKFSEFRTRPVVCAIAGALLTVLAIVPVFGIQGAARFAASLNLLLSYCRLCYLFRNSSLEGRPKTVSIIDGIL